MKLGSYEITNTVMLAPMAGVTDWPFREVCRSLGAGYAVGEMTASKPELRKTKKSVARWPVHAESGLRVVQLLGADPDTLADAARFAQDIGADVIDINMGCPAKKVLQVACGSALMKDEVLVARILETVVNAVSLPVTLKMRTGWDAEHKNAARIARIAEQAGIALLTVHGRTRADGFRGEAEYRTIALVKSSVSIPVIANGDITSGLKARAVMQETAADGVMIGRAAYGNPWLFSEVCAQLGMATDVVTPNVDEVQRVVDYHMALHFDFYEESLGVRLMRKHLRWYFSRWPEVEPMLLDLLTQTDLLKQKTRIEAIFDAIRNAQK